MVDVLNETFREWLPEIKTAIEEASFVAIDFEFLGLPSSARDDLVPTLFDESDARYRKIVQSVRRYPPCQMGLACFKEINEGQGYAVESFSISLFKRLPRKVFCFSLSAVSFLANNNFDFNKFICQGVTYSNRREIADLKRDILQGEIDFDIFEDGLEHRLQMLKINLQRVARNSERAAPSTFHRASASNPKGGYISLPHPILIELTRSTEFVDTETLDQSLHPPWDRPLTPLEVATVVYVLSSEHRNLEFHVNPARTVLYTAEVPLIVRNAVTEEARIATLLKDLLKEVSGVSEIVQAIVDKKAPIVGHNSFLDLMYLYESFVNDLPDSYEEWKRCTRRLFPTIFDTKIVACCLKQPLSEKGVSDHSLRMLGTFFASPSCGQIVPFSYPSFTDGELSIGALDEGEHYHNAAFDAKVTGLVFVKLLYLYAHVKSAGLSDFTRLWPLRKLIFACRGDVANRVPIPLIDYLHCYLPGADPHGHRPSPLRARKRRTWPVVGHADGPIGYAIDRVADALFPLPKITEAELIPLRGELKREFGAFRIDVKLCDETHGVVLVATNTPKTFARVARYLSAHSWLRPMDDGASGEGVSWEELLMGSEDQKRRRKHHTRRRRRTTTTGDVVEGGRENAGAEAGTERTGTVALWIAGVTASLFVVGTAVYLRY